MNSTSKTEAPDEAKSESKNGGGAADAGKADAGKNPLAGKRRTALIAIAAVVLVIGLGYALWYWFHGRDTESTDNAYVQANIVQITPQAAGTVTAIQADDTDFVRQGTLLVALDPSDARVALDQAEAQLAQTVREVRTLYSNDAAQKAQVALREADLKRAQAEVARAQDDVARRAPLVADGAVGREEFDHANAQLTAMRSAQSAAQAALEAAREQLASSQVLTDGTAVEQQPNVLRAAARVREAWLALNRTRIVAPVAGLVARRSVQVGQRVQPGAPLMAVIPLDRAWVDANFKENQLRRLHIGQPAELTADVYGGKVDYHGRVVGLGAGTGSAFSLLPAQNATGNWIKIVQRVPVRIELDSREIAAHPLRVGLSMDVKVDVTPQNGRNLGDASRDAPRDAQAGAAVAQTPVFDSSSKEADAAVARIVAANLGTPARAGARR